METENQSNWPNSLIAVISGAAATLLFALITYPLMEAAASPFFELNFGVKDPGITTNDIIFLLIITCWFTLAALAGGLVTAIICRAYPYRHTGILILLTLVFFGFIFADSSRDGEMIYILLMVLCTIGGFLAGTKIGKQIAMKRKAKKETLS